ncbi:6336_t:CDS:2 [Funneliformis mosseae]|uniref:6336_t:CDS:1 n=1 Tax=Funneliformis mosseae TaxID=27381 RepID=A0A9N8ZT95_FUNMO|nr:6336_t:CDS:2 [Funneliformis mosseae]
MVSEVASFSPDENIIEIDEIVEIVDIYSLIPESFDKDESNSSNIVETINKSLLFNCRYRFLKFVHVFNKLQYMYHLISSLLLDDALDVLRESSTVTVIPLVIVK